MQVVIVKEHFFSIEIAALLLMGGTASFTQKVILRAGRGTRERSDR